MKNYNIETRMKGSIDSVKPLSESVLQSIASVNLSFSNATIKSSQADLEATFSRIQSGETTYEGEEERLLKRWNELHSKEKTPII